MQRSATDDKAKPEHGNDVVAALAGRRIDAQDAKVPRFPLWNVPSVKLAISKLLEKERVTLLICSAACGADLLALDAATRAGIRCRVILPFEPERFRQTSVVDRPGDWGKLFDRIITEVDREGCLVILNGDTNLDSSYQLANEVIIQEAVAASNTRPLAILVWEGRRRDEGDLTAQFRSLAIAVGMSDRTVPTLCISTPEYLQG